MKDRDLGKWLMREDEAPYSSEKLYRLKGGGYRSSCKDKGLCDSQLAVSNDRFTYTFVLEGEVASIHFNSSKREIYFKGHHIKNLELTASQRQALKDLKLVINQDKIAQRFYDDYCATLDREIADK